MTCMLCPSPAMLDQSFPRDADEVERIGKALGVIQMLIEEGRVSIVMTESLGDFVDEFDWARSDLGMVARFLQPMHHLLTQWVLQPSQSIVSISRFPEVPYTPHPIPSGSTGKGLIEFWSEEVGKLYAVHELTCPGAGMYYIGIACDYAFAEMEINDYEDCTCSKAFPLVGPNTLSALVSAYEPELPRVRRNSQVAFSGAKNNCKLLGATHIEQPHGGSHYKVYFPDAPRPWILDPNNDPVPEPFLRELVELTGYSLEEIIYILSTGRKPKYRLRLYKYIA